MTSLILTLYIYCNQTMVLDRKVHNMQVFRLTIITRFALLLSFQELNSIANQEEKEVEGLSTSTAA